MNNNEKKSGYVIRNMRALPRLQFLGSQLVGVIGKDITDRLSCYRIKMPKGGYAEPAFHKKAVEMIWIMRGGGIAYLGDGKKKVSSGDVIFIRSRTTHAFRAGRRGMELLSVTTPHVDSRTDFYATGKHKHAPLKVVSGKWLDGKKILTSH